MAKLFGFKIEDTGDKDKKSKVISPVPKNDEDTSDFFISSGFYGQYVDIEGIYKNEADLVRRYREMALHPECDSAIEDIVNEAIVSDLNDSPVQIDLTNLPATDKLKDVIRKEFKYLKEMMDFDKKAHEIFRNWYVDGRIYYHKVIDLKKPQEGIKEVRYIDPLKLRYIKKLKKTVENNLSSQVRSVLNKEASIESIINPEIEEFYLYDPNAGFSATVSNLHSSYSAASKTVKLTTDSITAVTSGLVDRNRQTILSYLHKAIKALNQLRMIEDSIVIYRLSRASEKRLFYIDVGNLPKIKAEQYMRDVMNRYRNKLVYDACLDMNTKVPLLDGRTLTLTQITDEFNKGERLWAYSCDPNTGKFSPGIISWAGVTRRNEKVMKITLDNDESITCTLDHKFPVWNMGEVEAKDLQVGYSMVPFYTRKKEISSGSKNSTYQQIYENESKKWKFVHRLVSKWKDENDLLNEFVHNLDNINLTKKTVHHIDYNRYNNSPENLVRMSRDDHFEYHKQHSSISGKIGGKVTAQRKRDNNIPFFNLTEEERSEIGKKGGVVGGKKCYKNHKIKSIEFLEEAIDVGTLTIDREEIYHNYHTFALEAGIYTCNSTGEIKDDRKYMAMLEDYWLPRRDGGRGTEVTTLPGGQNLGELTDIEYFQKKLYKSLGVPSTRLDAGGGFNLGRSSEILRDELKFTRFVGRLRKRFSQIFVDMLKTQLILKNIVTPEDWESLADHIQFDFLYDNHFAELKKNEILNDKLGVVAAMEPYLGKYFSIDYVRRGILNQSDDEIIEIDKQIQKEIEAGLIANPADMMAQQQGMEGQPAPGNVDTLGSPVKEPGVSTSNIEPGEI